MTSDNNEGNNNENKKFIGEWLESIRAEIPNYQRGYSWEQDQIDDFLNDLNDESLESDSSEYFFGPIVTIKDKDEREQIIDGQQRITTITIFLSVIKDISKALERDATDTDSERAMDIANKYIGKEGDYRIVQKGLGKSFFSKNIQYDQSIDKFENIKLKSLTRKKGKKPTDNIMASAYNRILKTILKGYELDKLDGDEEGRKKIGEKTSRLYNTLIKKFYIFEISSPHMTDAFQIFQTLNARGKDLTSSDLIKSHFFGVNKDESKAETLGNNWKKAQTNLCSEDITDYLRYLWNSKETFATKRNLYRKVIDNVGKNVESIMQLSSDIGDLSLKFSQISGIRDMDEEIKEYMGSEGRPVNIIQELNTLGFHSYYPILLSLFRLKESAEPIYIDFEEILVLIRRILFRNKILGKGTNWLEKEFSRIASLISSANNPKDIKNAMSVLKESIHGELSDKRISDSLKEFNFKGNVNFAKSLLRTVENFDFDHKEYKMLDPKNDINLEHIMPQSPKSDVEYGFDNEDEREEYLWRIGNLTLWNGNDNSALKNLSFSEKVKGTKGKNNGYRDSAIVLTKDLGEKKPEWNNCNLNDNYEWNRETISRRNNYLVKKIIKL